jgi:hypothetical protein
MASGRQLWEGAELADRCGAMSATSLRFVALAQILAEAEDAIVSGRTEEGVGAFGSSKHTVKSTSIHSYRAARVAVPVREA